MPRQLEDNRLEQLTKMLDLPLVKAALANGLVKERQDLAKQRCETIAELQAAETKLTTQDLPPIDARISVAKLELEKARQRVEAASIRLAEAQRERSTITARFDHQKNKSRFFLSRSAPDAVAQWSVELQKELDALDKTGPTEQSTESSRWFQGRPVLEFRSNRPSLIRRVRALRKLLHNIHEISFCCSTEEEAVAYIEKLRANVPEIAMEVVQ